MVRKAFQGVMMLGKDTETSEPELIGIDLVRTAALSGDGLPLVRSMKVDIQFLSSTEGIALG